VTWLKCVENVGDTDEQAVWVNAESVMAMRPHDRTWSLVYLRQPHAGSLHAPAIPATLYVQGTTVAIAQQTQQQTEEPHAPARARARR